MVPPCPVHQTCPRALPGRAIALVALVAVMQCPTFIHTAETSMQGTEALGQALLPWQLRSHILTFVILPAFGSSHCVLIADDCSYSLLKPLIMNRFKISLFFNHHTSRKGRPVSVQMGAMKF